MRFQGKLLTVLAGASLLGSGIATIGAAEASAAPAGVVCSYGTIYQGGSIVGYNLKCTGVTFHYRVSATCTDELRGSSVAYHSSYVAPGKTAQVICPFEGGTQWLASNPSTQHT